MCGVDKSRWSNKARQVDKKICDLHKNHQILFVERTFPAVDPNYNQTPDMIVKSMAYWKKSMVDMMMMVIMGSDPSVGCLLLVGGGGEAHLASGNIPVPAITIPLASPYDLHCNAQV